MTGLRERDGGLWGSTPGYHVKFKPPTNSFLLKLLVDGPQVYAYVNDELVSTYHTTDGSAIEGYVGFGSGQGAYLVSSPTVQRRDRSAAAFADPLWPKGLDVAAAGKQTRTELINVACRGIPTSPTGTVVLWIPEIPSATGDAALGYTGVVTGTAIGLDDALKTDGCNATFLVALPEKAGEDLKKAIEGYLKENVARATGVIVHRHATPLSTRQDGESPLPEPVPSTIFVAPDGVIRVIERFERGQRTLHPCLRQWIHVFEALAAAKKT